VVNDDDPEKIDTTTTEKEGGGGGKLVYDEIEEGGYESGAQHSFDMRSEVEMERMYEFLKRCIKPYHHNDKVEGKL
jgi:hypothetical protein